jgi:3-oxoacyl-[acyl-carrier protein] reductase
MNILITGGASGLGEAITRQLAKDLNNTIYFTFSKSAANAKKIEIDCANCISIKCDFTNEIEMRTLLEKINITDIDVLINNAYNGAFLKTYFHKQPANDFLEGFVENIIPVIKITQTAINNFRKKKKGKIITILTAALVNVPPIGSAIYIANKAYLEKLTKVWASENTKFNIISNSISPAFMETNLTADIDERLVEQIKESHPQKKILTVNEVADAVSFLVNASSQINGVDIPINAGANLK